MLPAPAGAVVAWLRNRRLSDDLFVTSITAAEILYGIELLPKGKRRDGLLSQADAMFAEDFMGRVLPFDEPAAHRFGKIAAWRRLQGRPMPTLDAQIAAIAIVHQAALATRNITDFEDCGLRLINPWKNGTKA
jgi:toxin FitB